MADNLSAQQKQQLDALKKQWGQANASGDKAAMDAAHKQAEAIRGQAGFSGGTDGSQYIPMQDATPKRDPWLGNDITAGIKTNLEQKAQQDRYNASYAGQIDQAKKEYEAAKQANDKAAMDAAHKQAEAIRAQLGYSGGADGSGWTPTGTMSAEDMAKWVADYERSNYDGRGWHNGFSSEMNLRSIANKIRQQMQANSIAWGNADKTEQERLHQQNLQLAELLRQSTGGAESTFNPQTGRWETWHGNLGYGTDMNFAKPDQGWHLNFAGMSPEQIKQYANDTDRYHNFIDTGIYRNWQDESNGFTGRYSQFVNGPYAQLLTGSHGVDPRTYMDLIGDGFAERDKPLMIDGKVVPTPPALKGGQFMSDYARDHSAYTQNGIIQPNVTNGYGQPGNSYGAGTSNMPGYTDRVADNPDNNKSVHAGTNFLDFIFKQPGNGTVPAGHGMGGGSLSGSYSSGGGGGGYQDMLNQMYDANLRGQLAQLESGYQQNLTDLDTALQKANDAYQEQKRQAAGQSDLAAANFRETANAQGLNSGSFGQAAMSQANQLQGELSALGAAQAASQAQIEQQRALLGKQYQLAILEAHSKNDFARAQALYQEAVRQDNALRQQAQFEAQMAQKSIDKILSMAKGGIQFMGVNPAGLMGDTPAPYNPNPQDEEEELTPGIRGGSPLFYQPGTGGFIPEDRVNIGNQLGIPGMTDAELQQAIRDGLVKVTD